MQSQCLLSWGIRLAPAFQCNTFSVSLRVLLRFDWFQQGRPTVKLSLALELAGQRCTYRRSILIMCSWHSRHPLIVLASSDLWKQPWHAWHCTGLIMALIVVLHKLHFWLDSGLASGQVYVEDVQQSLQNGRDISRGWYCNVQCRYKVLYCGTQLCNPSWSTEMLVDPHEAVGCTGSSNHRVLLSFNLSRLCVMLRGSPSIQKTISGLFAHSPACGSNSHFWHRTYGWFSLNLSLQL